MTTFQTRVQASLLSMIKEDVPPAWDVRPWGAEIRIVQWDNPTSENKTVKHWWFIRDTHMYLQVLPSLLEHFDEKPSEQEARQTYIICVAEEIRQGLNLHREPWEQLTIEERGDWYVLAWRERLAQKGNQPSLENNDHAV